jgi:putative endonuclease
MKEIYYAYVLKSKVHNYYYKGHCKDLQKRLIQHNSGMTVSIRPYIPFEIVYFEEFETEIEAIKREKYFKTSRGREFLRKILAE